MGDEDVYDGKSEDLQGRYERDMERVQRDSWGFAFFGLFLVFLGFVSIDALIRNPNARALALGVVAFCCVAALMRFAIKWVWQSRLKTKYAEKVMLS